MLSHKTMSYSVFLSAKFNEEKLPPSLSIRNLLAYLTKSKAREGEKCLVEAPLKNVANFEKKGNNQERKKSEKQNLLSSTSINTKSNQAAWPDKDSENNLYCDTYPVGWKCVHFQSFRQAVA